MMGVDTRFLTGTDEHSINIAQAAIDAGRSPRDFVDEQVEDDVLANPLARGDHRGGLCRSYRARHNPSGADRAVTVVRRGAADAAAPALAGSARPMR